MGDSTFITVNCGFLAQMNDRNQFHSGDSVYDAASQRVGVVMASSVVTYDATVLIKQTDEEAWKKSIQDFESRVIIHIKRIPNRGRDEKKFVAQLVNMHMTMRSEGETPEEAVRELVADTEYPDSMRPAWKLVRYHPENHVPFQIHVRQVPTTTNDPRFEACLDREWNWIVGASDTPGRAAEDLRRRARGLEMSESWEWDTGETVTPTEDEGGAVPDDLPEFREQPRAQVAHELARMDERNIDPGPVLPAPAAMASTRAQRSVEI